MSRTTLSCLEGMPIGFVASTERVRLHTERRSYMGFECKSKGRLRMRFDCIWERVTPGCDLPTKERDYHKMSGPVRVYNVKDLKEGEHVTRTPESRTK